MTLSTLVISIAIVAVILTAIIGLVFKKVENWPISYLQNFVGALFIFSGWVKAIDPLGTAYKMEQYFAEFETTFEGTWFSFLAPMFPTLSEYALAFSVIVIVFEIILALMLLLGAWPKFTTWAFMLLVGFFTFLTGFTYLTGYVPEGVNFFQFSKWGAYVETNMKVTDCGCFGDFLKLEPKVSFLKDVFLLIPAFLFLFYKGKMHQLFSAAARNAIIGIGTLAVTIYCFSNFSWDLPHTDFRPFNVGNDVVAQKQLEEDAAINVEVIAYKLTNKSSGEVLEIPFAAFLKDVKNYPKEEWEYDQIKSEPTIEATKISDFEVSDVDGNDMTESILTDEGYSFMIVAYKLYGETQSGTETVYDTTYTIDSILNADTIQLVKRIDEIKERQMRKDTYEWSNNYLNPWTGVVNPVMDKAQTEGYKVYAVTGYADPAKLDDFRHASQSAYPFYTADDILLKTIVRSNPGVVLWKGGKIIQKWHYKKLPDFDKIKAAYLQ